MIEWLTHDSGEEVSFQREDDLFRYALPWEWDNAPRHRITNSWLAQSSSELQSRCLECVAFLWNAALSSETRNENP